MIPYFIEKWQIMIGIFSSKIIVCQPKLSRYTPEMSFIESFEIGENVYFIVLYNEFIPLLKDLKFKFLTAWVAHMWVN